jgi:chromosome partitioning protein
MAGSLVAIAKRKGGVGASTIAAALGGAWDALGKRVVLLDSDPQQSLMSWGDIAEEDDSTLARITRSAVFESDEPLTAAIEKARAEADVVIIDTRPGLHVQAIEVAAVADVAVLPCGPSPLDLQPQRDMLRVLQRARGESLRPAIAMVPTRFTNRTRLGRELPESLAAVAESMDLQATVTPGLSYRVGYGECVLMGQTPEEYGETIREEARALAQAVEELL